MTSHFHDADGPASSSVPIFRLPVLLSLTGILFLSTGLDAIEVSDGFNYPIGARNRGSVTEAGEDDGWYNALDFGVYDSFGDGHHAGEDWNDECYSEQGDKDLYAPVYAVSHGEVIGSRPVSGGAEGEVLVLRHQLASGESLYSLYLHIEVDDDLVPGSEVKRDQQIGRITTITGAPHLHFELRTKPVNVQPGEKLWPSDDDSRPNNAYYNSDSEETWEQKMAKDGLIHDPPEFLDDPSEFLDDHRVPPYALERGRIPRTFTFERDLEVGECRYEVRYLQILLNSDPDTRVTSSGPGSLGTETSNFLLLTEDAVKRFQSKYLDQPSPTGRVDGETRTELNRILGQARRNPNVDVALIIDSSGSMTWNDPNNSRLDAARAYLTGSFAGDFVGIVDFDGNVRVASQMRQLPEHKDALIEAINTIDSSGGTNIGLGIQVGCDTLTESPSQHNLTKGALLLTDGAGSFSGQDECFVKRGWPIYTFGLGSGADHPLLRQISSNTGAEHTELPATSLICEFQRVRAKIADAEPPPCTSIVVFSLEFTTFFVRVESGQLQATFSLDWIGSDIVMALTTPSGRVIDRSTVSPDVSHDKGTTFEIYTITDPEVGDWEVEIFGADVPAGGEEAIFGFSTVPAPIVHVAIEVKPDGDPNSVNPHSMGVIPVAIVSTSTAAGEAIDFDAWDVDPWTVLFGPSNAVITHANSHAEDVDGDGDIDMVLHFKIQETGIACGDTEVTLTGETTGGEAIEGRDSIITVGCE